MPYTYIQRMRESNVMVYSPELKEEETEQVSFWEQEASLDYTVSFRPERSSRSDRNEHLLYAFEK